MFHKIQQLGWGFIALIALLLILQAIEMATDGLALRFSSHYWDTFKQPWRLLTAHLVHGNWTHLGLNLINLILVRLVFWEWITTTRFVAFLGFCSLFISIGLSFLSEFGSYVGFSGVFHGLLCYLLVHYWRQSKWLYGLILLGLMGKVISEQVFGPSQSLVALIGLGVEVNAHALGLIGALIFIAWEFLHKKN